MSDARSPRAAVPARAARFAPFAALCASLLLAGCYVVPVAPAAEPVYRPVYPKPYYSPRPYRGYGPYGLGSAGGGTASEASFARQTGAETGRAVEAEDVSAAFEDTARAAVSFAEAGGPRR